MPHYALNLPWLYREKILAMIEQQVVFKGSFNSWGPAESWGPVELLNDLSPYGEIQWDDEDLELRVHLYYEEFLHACPLGTPQNFKTFTAMPADQAFFEICKHTKANPQALLDYPVWYGFNFAARRFEENSEQYIRFSANGYPTIYTPLELIKDQFRNLEY